MMSELQTLKKTLENATTILATLTSLCDTVEHTAKELEKKENG